MVDSYPGGGCLELFKRDVSILMGDVNWNGGRVAICHALKAQMLTEL